MEGRKEIGSIQIGRATKLVVNSFPGRTGEELVDIRIFVSGERYSGPTRKGVTLPLSHLDELISILQKAKR